MVNMQGNDPNRHVAFMNNDRPYDDGTVRPVVPVTSQQNIDGHLQFVLSRIPLGGSLVTPATKQFSENYRAAANRWHMASADLDNGVVAPKSKFLSMLGVFILDTMAFTFTFFGLFETLYEAQIHNIPSEIRPPVPYLYILPSAAFVAAFVTLAIKKLANGAVTDRGAKVAYFAGWTLFACADFYYLMSKNVTGVGVIATGLLVVMCALTLVHAKNESGGTPNVHAYTMWDDCHREIYNLNQRLHATLMYVSEVETPEGMQVVSLLTNWTNVDASILVDLGIPHVMDHLGRPTYQPMNAAANYAQTKEPTILPVSPNNTGQVTPRADVSTSLPDENPVGADFSRDANRQQSSGNEENLGSSTDYSNQQPKLDNKSTVKDVDIVP